MRLWLQEVVSLWIPLWSQPTTVLPPAPVIHVLAVHKMHLNSPKHPWLHAVMISIKKSMIS